MMRILLPLLAAAGIACGGGSPIGRPPPASPSSPSANGPSVSQVASLVAGHERDLRENIAAVEPCQTGRDAPACDFAALLTHLTLATEADTLRLELEAIEDPPAEVAALVTETADAARRVKETYEALCDPGEDCPADNFEFHLAVGDLESSLDAWTPYL